MFEKPKFKNKNQVGELKELFAENQIWLEDLPRDVLAELLRAAVEKIDDLENGGEYDERDFADSQFDKECIVEDLFKELETKIKNGLYE